MSKCSLTIPMMALFASQCSSPELGSRQSSVAQVVGADDESDSNPCEGRPDGERIGCGFVNNADGQPVSTVLVCQNGQVSGGYGCDRHESCRFDPSIRDYSCTPDSCSSGTPPECFNNAYSYCDDSGHWNRRQCNIDNLEFCNSLARSPEAGCFPEYECNAFTAYCSRYGNYAVSCEGGEIVVRVCENTACSGGACVPPVREGDSCLDGNGNPRPSFCQGLGQQAQCVGGQWHFIQCTLGACEYNSAGQGRCVSTVPVIPRTQ